MSFGLRICLVDTGDFMIMFDGRIGLSVKLPAQVGHTFSKIVIAHFLQ